MMIVLAYAAAMGINAVSELESQLPPYRGNELKISEFAANYNFYDELLMNNTNDHMYSKGQLPDDTRVLVLEDHSELEYDLYPRFEYALNGDTIASINFHHTWYEWQTIYNTDLIDLAAWSPDYCDLALITAVLAQEGSQDELDAALDRLLWDMAEAPPDGHTGIYGNIAISWDLQAELIRDNPANYDVYEMTLDLKIEFP